MAIAVATTFTAMETSLQKHQVVRKQLNRHFSKHQTEGSDSDSDDKDSLQARGDLGLQMNYAFCRLYRHFLPDLDGQTGSHLPKTFG